MRPLRPTPKGYTLDSDKLCSPEATVAKVKKAFAKYGGILEELRRTDTGRLGIPVYLSICGPAARDIMPTRKQMGKGASPAQAEASALMELAERFSYFSFFANEANFTNATWSQAQKLWPGRVLPISQILQSVNDPMDEKQAARLMDLLAWRFHGATRVLTGQSVAAPLDWFKKLNEFNGASSGNCLEESILQGACELAERHVSALIDRQEPVLPTIRRESIDDPVLKNLVAAFEQNGVKLWLKDASLGMPVPTVAALAYDPATLGVRSEIVFTAGAAASPVKAAVRAVTEVAQLAGGFETGSNYEASGLRKFLAPDETRWLTDGPQTDLTTLPDLTRPDILDELHALALGLSEREYTLYTVETTQPGLGVAANYSFVPGLLFRERANHASLGMFVGRALAEEAPEQDAIQGLETLAQICPKAFYLPFHQGLLALRLCDTEKALRLFEQAEPLQPDPEEQGMALFYQAFTHTQRDEWERAEPLLSRAISASPEVKEYYNLRGVARFKAKNYTDAACDFETALALDSGSAMDLANLGLCHKFLGHNDAAAEFLSQALAMDPGLDFAKRHLEEITPQRFPGENI